jgi:YD repeat-containing protein
MRKWTMIGDKRVKLAAAILIGVLSLLGSVQAHAASGTAVRYACDAHQNLVVERSATRAVVQFVDRTYELRRKPSSIGQKYLSPTAALIVDGASAVFVAEDRLQLGQCVEARLTASR